QQHGQPGQQYGPSQQFGQPGQYGQPSEPYGPSQQYGQPGQQHGQQYSPSQQFGQPGQQYGQPYPQTQQYPGFPPQPDAWSSPGGEQYGQPGGYPGYPAAPQPKKRNGLLVGAIAVVVLLVVGAATAFFAFRGAQAGAPTPKEA